MAAVTISQLDIKINAQTEQLRADLKKVNDRVSRMGDGFARVGRNLRNLLGGLSVLAGGRWLVRVAADAEKTAAEFQILLGSVERANVLLAELEQFSLPTPFTPNQIKQAAKGLLGYQVAMEDVTETLSFLGDISAASGARLQDLVDIFGKVQSTGRVSLEEVTRLAERAIPIYAALEQVTGRSGDELRKLISTGKLGLPELEQALRSMASEGGFAFRGMEISSRTLVGQISTLQGAVELLGVTIGRELLPAAKAVTAGIIDLVTWMGNLDLSTVKTTVQISAFVGTLFIVLRVLPRVIALFKAAVQALRALAQAQIFAQATALGAVKALAAVGAAAAAAFAAGKAFDRMTRDIENADAAAQSLANTTDQILQTTRATARAGLRGPTTIAPVTRRQGAFSVIQAINRDLKARLDALKRQFALDQQRNAILQRIQQGQQANQVRVNRLP